MRKIIAAVAAALVLASVPANAGIFHRYGEADSRVHRDASWDRLMLVEARYRAPSSCYRIVERSPETRADEPGPPVTVIYTLIVARDRGPCERGSAILSDEFVVHADTYTLWVRLRFVTPGGKLLKTERLGLTGV